MKDKNKPALPPVVFWEGLTDFFPNPENIFRQIVMNSPDGTIISDLSGKILFASPQTLELVGITTENIPLETTILDWIDPSDHQKALSNFEKVIKGVLEPNHRYLLVKKDKTCFYGAINASALMGKDGKPFGLVATIRDISNLKKIEEESKQSEFKYHLLFESANDAIFLMYEDVFIECNIKTLEMFGCKKDEIIGKSPYFFSPPFQPDGQDSETKALHVIHAALEGKPQSFDWVHKRLNGALFDAEVSLNSLQIDGKIYLQAIVRDITEWKKTQDKLKKFNECFLSFKPDCDENINRLTSLCGQVLGADCALYNRVQGGLLCSLGQWNTPEDYNAFDKPEGHICFDVIRNNKEEILLIRNLPETIYFHSDQNVKKYNLKTYMGVKVSFAGKAIGSLCVVFQRDFIPEESEKLFLSLAASAIGVEEERKLATDQVIAGAEKLKDSIDAKDKFFSIIAHDLKGPFNAIIGFSDILTSEWNEFLEEEKLHFIKNIHSSAKNTFQLLENLLEWSMTQTGKMAFMPQSMDLSVISNEIVILLRAQAEKKHIRIFSAINFRTLVLADENMVKTIFRNLISNAIKFTPPGGQIKIFSKDFQADSHKPEMVQVCIVDSGIGIAEETLPKLFRIDEKTRTQGTAEERGTGLGLILSRELVEKNGGKIWVESELHKGSQFCFTLPKIS